MKSIKNMTDEELGEQLAAAEAELGTDTATELKLPVVVIPFDEMIREGWWACADVRGFDWAGLGAVVQFDVILMDPPWMIQSANPTRDVELNYELLPEDEIARIPMELVQRDGFMFMWVIVLMLWGGLKMLEKWGYRVFSTVNWIKVTRKGIYAPSNGGYLQHAKETCLVAVKGQGYDGFKRKLLDDLIIAWRNLRQSHKPDEMYGMIERAFLDAMCMEVFARPHNLREGWFSLGLEVPH
jgi:N6-adenosine-specific RNA methylase IME4